MYIKFNKKCICEEERYVNELAMDWFLRDEETNPLQDH